MSELERVARMLEDELNRTRTQRDELQAAARQVVQGLDGVPLSARQTLIMLNLQAATERAAEN